MNETTANEPAGSGSWRRGFWSLIAVQFQGAFSDNFLRWVVGFLVLAMGLEQARRDRLFVLVVPLLFSIPFLLFSMAGGYLADRYSKRLVTIGTKAMEIAVAWVALAGLARGSLALEFTAIFLISTQAALFGPSKYGLLPELLPEKRLSWGNGILELGTFLAVITGTLAAGLADKPLRGREYWAGVILIALAIAGLGLSLGISRVPAARPKARFRANPLGDLLEQIGIIRKDRVLALAVLGNIYFWFLGSLLLINVVLYAQDILRAPAEQSSLLLAVISLGIGAGSLAAGYLSGGKIEYGLVPLGVLGISAITVVLSVRGLGFPAVASLLAGLGFFAGFFAVPVNALIQHRPRPEEKGGIIAAANLLSFVGIALQPVAQYAMIRLGHPDPGRVFLITSLATLGAGAYAVWLLPDSFLRLLLWLATHTVYRITVAGRENVPERGGALLVSNHMSFVDALLLVGSTDRPIRFLVFKDIYEKPALKPFMKMMRAIPISSQQRPRELIRALQAASEAIRAGELVCLFAEGQITRIGQLLPFRRGMERIMKGVEAPIVPVALDGVWGSIFSFEKGRFVWKAPRQIPYPVTVSFGAPMPATATPFAVREAVQRLATAAWQFRKRRMKTLGQWLVRNAHRSPLRTAMGDPRFRRVSAGGALLRAILLARRLAKEWRGERMAGILVPPSVGGALVNFAAVLLGKIPVNLNYTAGEESLASCARQCGIETVVASKALVERMRVKPPGRILYLEDLAARPRLGEKLAALALWTLPGRALERVLGGRAAGMEDLATVLFSSGTTAEPKGVMLSQFNIVANIEQVGQTFMLGRRDCLLGTLPFFHSFGFTMTLWLPVVLGVGVVYHPNPFDLGAIGELAREHRVTFLLATPTFLQAYLRRSSPEDFGSVQYVLVGAEKLPEKLALEFEERFGVRPLEGYGCTECAPVVAVNTRDFRAAGFRQVGAKRGHIGHPLPGVSVRIVEPETFEPVPVGQPGLLLTAGPNVMQGYLGQPEKTAASLRDGWYVTGDIGVLDDDGFLTLTDRLSRFAKIGGEMVPLGAIEENLQELAGTPERVFAVAALPDEKKGERLVVLTTLGEERMRECIARLSETGLPNLWMPRPNQFFHVDALPITGTGKLDLRAMRETAAALSAGS
ncbi:MAG TPA: acyl-[ACP]--phospholipid O-acyltransferase [Candidatus Acidoferrales bacterium]|nr:acyl-[ACP]--phospholipid O-acyltransferase [Candidatus Acidoferrales bacterium]